MSAALNGIRNSWDRIVRAKCCFPIFFSGIFTLKLGEDKAMMRNVTLKPVTSIIGFLRGGCPRGGGNWGTLRIPREP